eukprot:COSAG01_NODE_14294_length_1472_cov_1.338674_2_plen_95_part_00
MICVSQAAGEAAQAGRGGSAARRLRGEGGVPLPDRGLGAVHWPLRDVCGDVGVGELAMIRRRHDERTMSATPVAAAYSIHDASGHPLMWWAVGR